MTDELYIRPLTIVDYDDLIRVWAAAGLSYRPDGRDRQDKVAREMERPDTAFFGLYQDDRLMAVGLATFDGRKGWINRVAVHPDFRRHGYACRIIEACEHFLQEQGAEIIAVLVEDFNLPSMALFQKLGYLYGEGVLYFSKRRSDDT